MKIVLDIMGADNSPEELIKGGLLFVQKEKQEIIIVGDKKYNTGQIKSNKYITFIESTEVIDMNDPPVEAVKNKKYYSIVLVINILKNDSADAFVSAANSGAVMTAALLNLGRLTGISRPAIAVIIPSEKLPVLIIDAGANMDCKARNLFHFALMGSVYYKNIFAIENPVVGLLNIGEEENKGNELVLETFNILKTSKLNFFGNVEGSDIPQGKVHVVTCDGFVGNILIKTAEGVASFTINFVKSHVNINLIRKIGFYIFLKGVVKEIKKKLDYDEYGGAPLLGVNGNVIICHGKSSAKAIYNALKLAGKLVEKRINENIKNELKNSDITGVDNGSNN